MLWQTDQRFKVEVPLHIIEPWIERAVFQTAAYRMKEYLGNENVEYHRIRGLFPTHNSTHNMRMSCATSAYLAVPAVL
jgi:hypothetical protein